MSAHVGTDPLCVLIGANVRRRREELGMSQAEVAVAVTARGSARWSAATVSSIETGRRNVGMSELADLLDVLQTTLPETLSTRAGTLSRYEDEKPLTNYRVHTLTAAEWQGETYTKAEVDMREVQQRRLEENVWGSLTNRRHPTASQRAALEAASLEVFGRSLLDEREWRVRRNLSGARIEVAKMGHATRSIISDLKAYFEQRGEL